MKVLLIDIDSTIPNIALKKIEKYHVSKGDEIIWNFDMAKYCADKIYVSCVFTKNRYLAEEWEGKAEIGGTGYDLHKKLPKEIEDIILHINWGFTTRGCVRKCSFCFVPEKEGKIHIVGDLYDIWDGKAKDVVLMDNNITALPSHMIKILKQAQKENIRLDFNQGLDIRLLTSEICEELKKTKITQIRFAYDNHKMLTIINKKMKLLHEYNIKAMWYVLVGFDSEIKEEINRINYLIKNNQRAYLMRHDKCNNDKKYIAFARWVNSPLFGKGTIPFFEYLNNTEDGKKYLKYFK
jgi:radical SAM superfamily enzyme YgiQ (UPF0313 family)